MKANEFRIGNLVLWGKLISIIKGIHTQSGSGDIHLYIDVVGNKNLKYYAVDISDIAPMPLTKEKLIEIGFNPKEFSSNLPLHWYEIKYLSNDYDEIMKSWVAILINIESFSCVIIDENPDEQGASTKKKIRYVHEIQNLWLDLTGEELIKEEGK